MNLNVSKCTKIYQNVSKRGKTSNIYCVMLNKMNLNVFKCIKKYQKVSKCI